MGAPRKHAYRLISTTSLAYSGASFHLPLYLTRQVFTQRQFAIPRSISMEAASREYRKVWISKTVLGILAIGTVVLRMHVRVNKKKQRVGWDDFFSVLSLLFMIADFVCNILGEAPSPGCEMIPVH
jgi:hypothetical protein